MGQDSLNIHFLGANRQFDWIELSIVVGDLTHKKGQNLQIGVVE